jgi:hypothetical protein
MRHRFKHLVCGLAFALVWWAIYRSPFARVLDVFVVAAIAGAIVWMTWDLFKWMCRARVLGPTELSTRPQFPWAVFGIPFAGLASTLLLVALGRRSGFPAGRWEELAVVVGGVVATLWTGMLMSSTEFRVSGLVYSGRAILWQEVGECTWTTMLGEEAVLVLTAKSSTIGWRRIPIPVSGDERPSVESILARHSVCAK